MMGYGYNMMNGWDGGWGWMGFGMSLTWLIWTIVGILVIIWLWQHIRKG